MAWFRLTALVLAAALLLVIYQAMGQLQQLHAERLNRVEAQLTVAAARLNQLLSVGDQSAVQVRLHRLVGGSEGAVLAARVIDIRGRPIAQVQPDASRRPSIWPAWAVEPVQDQLHAWLTTPRRLRLATADSGLGYLIADVTDAWFWPPGHPVDQLTYLRAVIAALVAAAAAIWLFLGAWLPVGSKAGARTLEAVPGSTESAASDPIMPTSRRLAQWFELLGYAVIVTDTRHRVRWMNERATTLTAWRLADARRQLVYSVFRPASGEDGVEATPGELALQTGQDVGRLVMDMIDRQGQVLSVEAGASRLMQQDRVIGVVLFFREATMRGQQARVVQDTHDLILSRLGEGVVTVTRAGTVDYANPHAARMFGYAPDDLPGTALSKLLPVPFLNSPDIQLEHYVGTDDGSRPRVVGWRKDATTFAIDLSVSRLPASGAAQYLLVLRERPADSGAAELSQRLGRLFDSAGEEVYIFDAQTLYFLDANRGARATLGYDRERLLRMTPLDLAPGLDEQQFHAHLSSLQSGDVESVTYQTEHRRADGASYPVEVTLSYSQGEQPPVFLAIAEEITARREAEARLQFIAHHDVLTELPNRLLFMDRLDQGMRRCDRTGRLLALVFVDLDLFKRVNDTLGHEIGDGLLHAVGQRLLENVRVTDTVARLAGDEFTLLLNGVVDQADVERIADKLLQAFEAPFQIDQHAITIGISMGIAIYPLDPVDAKTLLRHADEAMYAVKRAGRGNYRVFDAAVTPDAERTLHIEQVLRNAIALDEIEILAEPVVRLADRQLAGVRVRVEWTPPDIGRVEQAELYDAAQRTGVLEQLELRLLRGACELYQGLNQDSRAGTWPFLVSLSTWQLRRRDFAIKVADLLQRHEMPGTRLVLGLEEGGLLDVLEGATGGFSVLRELGVEFDILSFGAGYQRLGRMAQCPIRFASLPDDVVHALPDPAAMATVGTLLATARGFGADVLAGGVSSESVIEHLSTAGVVLGHGPALAPVVREAEFQTLVKALPSG